MGGGSSKTTSNIDIVNNSIIEAVVSSTQNCASSINANQQVTHSGFGLFTGATQNVSLSVICLQKVIVDNQLLAQMAQKIIQNVQANNGTIFGGSASSDANQNIQNYLKTKITTSFVQNCVSSTIASQQIKYSGVQIGTFDSQGVTSFQQCMSSALNNNNVAQGITTNTTQTGTASNTGSSLFGDLFGSLGDYFYYILIFIILIVIGYFVWTSFKTTDKQQPVSPEPVSPEPISSQSI
jgi:hypothetical protein